MAIEKFNIYKEVAQGHNTGNINTKVGWNTALWTSTKCYKMHANTNNKELATIKYHGYNKMQQ